MATTTRSTPLECEASSFDDIWAHDNVAAGLLQGKVPKLALVDPNNHDAVYFVQDTACFALDVRALPARMLGGPCFPRFCIPVLWLRRCLGAGTCTFVVVINRSRQLAFAFGLPIDRLLL